MRAHRTLGRLAAVATAGALAAGLLGGCDPAAKLTGPDPQEAADTLATALSSGDFGKVAFISDTPARGRHGVRHHRRGDGRRDAAGQRRRREGVRRLRDRHAPLDLAARRGRVDLRDDGADDPRRRRVAGRLAAGPRRARPGRRATGSTPPRSRRAAARSSAPTAPGSSPTGRWSASASTGRRCPRRQAVGVRAEAGGRLVGIDPARVRQAGPGRRRRRRSSRRSSTAAASCRAACGGTPGPPRRARRSRRTCRWPRPRSSPRPILGRSAR